MIRVVAGFLLSAVFYSSAVYADDTPPWAVWQRDNSENWGQRIGRKLGLSGFKKSIAVLVGVSGYQGSWPPLESPAYDLEKMTNFLRGAGEFDTIYSLSEKTATYDNLRSLMTGELMSKLSSGDRVLFYFSGHGTTKPLHGGKKVGYLVTSQALESSDFDKMIGFRELRIWWEDVAAIANQSLFIVDACFSGVGLQSASTLAEKEIKQLSRRGHHMITAGLDTEQSWGDVTKWGGSLFTHVLINAMSGAADEDSGDNDGIVTLKEIWSYTAEKVRKEAPEIMTPQLGYLEVNMPGEYFFTTKNAFAKSKPNTNDRVSVSRREYDQLQSRLRQLEELLQTNESKSDQAKIALLQENRPSFDDAPSEVKLGILLGYTGPIESMTPAMSKGAETAIGETNRSGEFLANAKVFAVQGDSTCIDAEAAVSSATQLIKKDGVSGIVGADCSGVASAVLQNVVSPANSVMISPSASSPGLSGISENGQFFRTVPSDSRQGILLANTTWGRGIKDVALTYTNNDYGKSLASFFEETYTALGGRVTGKLAHEDGKSNYAAEIEQLAQGGSTALVVAGYFDQGGGKIVEDAYTKRAFETFILPDGMYGTNWVTSNLERLNNSFGMQPYVDTEGMDRFKKAFPNVELGPFVGETYDAAALLILAIQAAGSSDPKIYRKKILEVANSPGEKIFPGELGKALKIIAEGGQIDYVGASNVEISSRGDATGTFREFEFSAKGERTTKYH